MKARSRRKTPQGIVSKTGVTVTENYCRVCMKNHPVEKFYQYTDTYLDRNGFMSVCKDAISKMYEDFYSSEHSMSKTILKMCRILNVKFDEETIESVKLHLQTQGKEESDPSTFGIYKAKLVATAKKSIDSSVDGIDFSFHEPIQLINEDFQEVSDDDFEDAARLKHFWGDKFTIEDYQWLEAELHEWKNSNKIDTRNEESLLQLIILKLFDIRKARNEGRETTQLEKSYQDLLKTSALSPNMMNDANKGKALDAWGLWVKDVENFTPAEVFADKSVYRDVDNLEEYGEKYITSPLRSFVTGSREFSIETNEGLVEEDDDESPLIKE